jgi:hypothetical protein
VDLIFGNLIGGKHMERVCIIYKFELTSDYLIYLSLQFKGLNIKDNGTQKLCAKAWNELDSDTRKYYEEEAKNAPNLFGKESFITNAKSRKTQINNGIQDIRKMVN